MDFEEEPEVIIKVNQLFKIFGNDPKRGVEHLRAGRTKQEIFEKTSLIVGLDDVSFEIAPGERVAVVGPNGAGKSTLFRVIAGVLRPSSGRLTLYGGSPEEHICVAFVPQRTHIDLHFPVNVRDVVLMGRTGRLGLLRRPGRADRRMVEECMELVGVADLAERRIGELSGGQQQRVFIARALAQEAQLMLMDEPLTGLDVNSQDEIYRILDEMRARGVTVLVATHDLGQAAHCYDRVMLLNRRLLGIGAAEEVFTSDLLGQAYGERLRLADLPAALAWGDACCHGEDE